MSEKMSRWGFTEPELGEANRSITNFSDEIQQHCFPINARQMLGSSLLVLSHFSSSMGSSQGMPCQLSLVAFTYTL